MIDYEKLAVDLAAARSVAEKVTHIRGDGGASNGDACHLRLPNARGASVNRAADIAGVELEKWEAGVWRVGLGSDEAFQGYMRTAKAEAVEKVLTARGWHARVHYWTD